MKNWIRKLKFNVTYFFKRFDFLRVYNSPFKRPGLKFYFGKIAHGTPYFFPRRAIRYTYKEAIKQATKVVADEKDYRFGRDAEELAKEYVRGYMRFVPRKIGFDLTSLGWKTKWTDTDFRFEWGPKLSFVFFKWQFCVWLIVPEVHHYWECWLYYTQATDKSKSVEDRLRASFEGFPCKWKIYPKVGKEAGTKKTVCYWDHILKEKYNGIRTDTEKMD